jgi:hypothetical protein
MEPRDSCRALGLPEEESKKIDSHVYRPHEGEVSCKPFGSAFISRCLLSVSSTASARTREGIFLSSVGISKVTTLQPTSGDLSSFSTSDTLRDPSCRRRRP